MSHLGTRLFADRLANVDVGLPAIVPLLSTVLHGTDQLPDVPLSIFDDTRNPRECSMITALPESGIQYPCIRVLTLSVDYADTNPTQDASGTWMTSGVLQLAAQVILRDINSAAAAAAGMYLLRAMRSVALFFNAATAEERHACGITLLPSMGIRQGKVDAPLGDTLVSPGALLVSLPFTESLPFSF